MQIFANLKKSLPHIRLSAIYKPMLERLSLGKGHPYVKSVCKEGQKIFQALDAQVQNLIELCAESGVDQEIVSGAQIINFAGDEL